MNTVSTFTPIVQSIRQLGTPISQMVVPEAGRVSRKRYHSQITPIVRERQSIALFEYLNEVPVKRVPIKMVTFAI